MNSYTTKKLEEKIGDMDRRIQTMESYFKNPVYQKTFFFEKGQRTLEWWTYVKEKMDNNTNFMEARKIFGLREYFIKALGKNAAVSIIYELNSELEKGIKEFPDKIKDSQPYLGAGSQQYQAFWKVRSDDANLMKTIIKTLESAHEEFLMERGLKKEFENREQNPMYV